MFPSTNCGKQSGEVCSFLGNHMGMGQNPIPLVNIKGAGKWMFIPLKMVLIGIDPYPYGVFIFLLKSCWEINSVLLCTSTSSDVRLRAKFQTCAVSWRWETQFLAPTGFPWILHIRNMDPPTSLSKAPDTVGKIRIGCLPRGMRCRRWLLQAVLKWTKRLPNHSSTPLPFSLI